MTTPIISRKNNPLIEKVLHCRDGKNKDFLFVEGPNLFDELCLTSHQIIDVFCVKEKESLVRKSLKTSTSPSARVHLVDLKLMKSMSDLQTPPGVIALVRRIPIRFDDTVFVSPLLLMIHRVQLPQNVGALLRTAEASGVSHIWTTKETADPFSAKTIRGSMGSLLRLNVYSGMDFVDSINQFKEEGYNVLGAVQGGKVRYDHVNWKQKSVLVIGNEGAGFSPDEIQLMTHTIQIPMAGDIDSLNASIAGSICMYESFRQRGFLIEKK